MNALRAGLAETIVVIFLHAPPLSFLLSASMTPQLQLVGLKDETVRTATLVVLWTLAGSHNASRSGCSGTGVQPLFWVNRD